MQAEAAAKQEGAAGGTGSGSGFSSGCSLPWLAGGRFRLHGGSTGSVGPPVGKGDDAGSVGWLAGGGGTTGSGTGGGTVSGSDGGTVSGTGGGTVSDSGQWPRPPPSELGRDRGGCCFSIGRTLDCGFWSGRRGGGSTPPGIGGGGGGGTESEVDCGFS